MSNFNAKEERIKIVQWIKDWFDNNGPYASAVIGISGGKDSSIVAALCVEALGKDRVFGVLMPNGEQSDISDARKLVDYLGIPNTTVNIKPMYDQFYDSFKWVAAKIGGCDKTNAIINTPPRIRMTVLYAVAALLPNGGRVANTCNASEDYVGYSTKFGDSVGDFSPLASLSVFNILELGDELGLPAELVHKAPADGLCGKTDEENLGFTYATLEKVMMGEYEDVDPAIVEKIEKLHNQNIHKIAPMPWYPGSGVTYCFNPKRYKECPLAGPNIFNKEFDKMRESLE